MPNYRLAEDVDGKEVVHTIRKMSHEVAHILNGEEIEKGSRARWRLGLGHSNPSTSPKSLHQIFRLLDVEGFTEFQIATIERYLENEAKQSVRRRKDYNDTRKKFAAYMKTQPEEFRKILGKMMKLQCGHSFQAGLQAGLAGRLTKQEIARIQEIEDEKDELEEFMSDMEEN